MGPMGPMGPMGLRGLMRRRGLRGPKGLIGPMGLMGLMGLMGCSSESTDALVEGPAVETGTAIAFSANQDGERTVTRTGLEEVGIKTFTVWAYKNTGFTGGTGSDPINYTSKQQVIPGYYVRWASNSAYTTTSNTNGWEYVNQQTPGELEQTIKYWDWGAKAYRFFGMAGGREGSYVVSEANGTPEKVVVTIDVNTSTDYDAEAMPYYSRLWFSTGRLPDYEDRQFGKPVTLEFVKPLTKVRFMFKFESKEIEENTVLAAKSFGPTTAGHYIYQKGTLTVTYPLTGTATEEIVTTTYNDAYKMADLEQDYYEEPNDLNARKWYTVLPAPHQGSYTLTVTVNGQEHAVVVPAEFMSWLPGYQYTYIFKVHVDGGVSIDSVQSAFTPWTPEYIGEHTVYNW